MMIWPYPKQIRIFDDIAQSVNCLLDLWRMKRPTGHNGPSVAQVVFACRVGFMGL